MTSFDFACLAIGWMNMGAMAPNLGERYYFSALLNLASGVLAFALVGTQ